MRSSRGVVFREVKGRRRPLMTGEFRNAILAALDEHGHGPLPVDVLRTLGRTWGKGCLDMHGLKRFVDRVRLKDRKPNEQEK